MRRAGWALIGVMAVPIVVFVAGWLTCDADCWDESLGFAVVLAVMLAPAAGLGLAAVRGPGPPNRWVAIGLAVAYGALAFLSGVVLLFVAAVPFAVAALAAARVARGRD